MDTLMIVGIILFIAGFILIAVEMVVPGFGAPGISGIACLVIGLFLTADTIEEGAFITVIVLALLGHHDGHYPVDAVKGEDTLAHHPGGRAEEG